VEGKGDDDESIEGAAVPEDGPAKPGFGSLKSVLSAVVANYKVCLQFAVKNFCLTNQSAGHRRPQK
jgi:hypothetical protein